MLNESLEDLRAGVSEPCVTGHEILPEPDP
jgi:hypothetical protein